MTTYHPVVELPENYPIFDLRRGTIPEVVGDREWGVGLYNELREDVYSQFYHGDRIIHLGVDLFGPAGTPVHAFADGEILMTGINDKAGDYGPTIICKHRLHDGTIIYALYGHLATKSLAGKVPGQAIKAGEIIAWIGKTHENGGWNSHAHFQLATEPPEVCDMPGTAAPGQLESALKRYPDPRTVLGPIF
ncbi:MAG TPA: peptidoglycan DD-metalloendopeptidase family protein [Candidatus Saccharimonadales bacterium]|nr:peptidoglycan DD-metalloendopeptidase family protein [Candidatus Saccharimonadales bacterium]